MVDSGNDMSFRSPVIAEPNLMPPMSIGSIGSDAILRTPAGNVRAMPAPPLPLVPQSFGGGGLGNPGGYNNSYGGFGSGYGGGYGGPFGGGYGGGTFGGFGGGYGGYGTGFGGGYGGYSRFGNGMNPMDPESRFIQIAEASSRPAFQSIESLVMAIGNIATMLDSTFFALTSSFRAILGVAANFGRLRGVFAQFWQTFALFRTVTWIYKKLLYWLRVSNLDPSSDSFKKAFDDAVNETSNPKGAPQLPRKGQSPWPVVAFLSFIFTAPYLIMKLLGTVSSAAQEEARNPSRWISPIESVALYNFQARNPSELSFNANQRLIIAPKEIQNTLGLLNTGWAMATTDGQIVGIIPINYVKSPQQLRQERTATMSQQNLQPTVNEHETQPINAVIADKNIPGATQPQLMNLSVNAFTTPPMHNDASQSFIEDFDIAPQPMGPPSTYDAALQSGF